MAAAILAIASGAGAVPVNAPVGSHHAPPPTAAIAVCDKPAPPAPYDTTYPHQNVSGFLDIRRLIDLVSASINNLEQVSDDLQARTEQLHCEEANTKALLELEERDTPDCVLETPTPYGPNFDPHTVIADDYVDIRAVMGHMRTFHTVARNVLEDLQVRVQRLHCGQSQIDVLAHDLHGHYGLGALVQEQHSCDQPPASPSYVQQYVILDASGVMDEKMASNDVATQHRLFEAWLDDLQGRVEQVRCQQANADALVSAVVAIQTRANGPLSAAPVKPDGFVAPRPAERLARLSSGVAQARAPVAISHPPSNGSEVGPAPTLERPQPRACSQVQADLIYVAEPRHWACASNGPQECTEYIAWIASSLGDMRRDIQNAAQDLQVRLNRAICSQRNLNDQLSYLRSTISR